MTRTVKRFAAVLLAAALLAGCAAGSETQDQPVFLELLSYIQEHPEDRDFGVAWCENIAAQVRSDLHFKPFMAGLFDVAESEGSHAMCAAMIEATIAGDLKDQDIVRFGGTEEEEGAAAGGTLLRALLLAHERLKTQQVQNPPSHPPGSSRPG